MQKTQVQSLDLEYSLEKEMTVNSSILAWRIPWTEDPGGPQAWVTKESRRIQRGQTGSDYSREGNFLAVLSVGAA